MMEIYKKEMSHFYRGLPGWLYNAAILFFTGLYTVIVNFNMAYPNFEYTLSNMSFIYIVTIPVLTMRSFAEEKKLKTDKLLYSLPVRVSGIVIGKYLALLSVLAVPCMVMLAYPLFLRKLGADHLVVAYAAILGFFLLGAALSSIGLFISTLTDNAAISAGGCFVAMLIIYFASSLADFLPSGANASFFSILACLLIAAFAVWMITRNIVLSAVLFCIGFSVLFLCYRRDPYSFIGLFPGIVGKLSLFGCYYDFANAILDYRTLLYDLSVIAVFLFFSVQVLERRRWN